MLWWSAGTRRAARSELTSQAPQLHPGPPNAQHHHQTVDHAVISIVSLSSDRPPHIFTCRSSLHGPTTGRALGAHPLGGHPPRHGRRRGRPARMLAMARARTRKAVREGDREFDHLSCPSRQPREGRAKCRSGDVMHRAHTSPLPCLLVLPPSCRPKPVTTHTTSSAVPKPNGVPSLPLNGNSTTRTCSTSTSPSGPSPNCPSPSRPPSPTHTTPPLICHVSPTWL